MSKPEQRKPGEKIPGTVDARYASRKDLHKKQENRSTEARLVSPEYSDDAIVAWKKKLKDLTGFYSKSGGLLPSLETDLRIKLGLRYRKNVTSKSQVAVGHDINWLQNFVISTPTTLINDARIDNELREDFALFAQKTNGLKTLFELLFSPPSEPTWIIDHDTVTTLDLSYDAFSRNFDRDYAFSTFEKYSLLPNKDEKRHKKYLTSSQEAFMRAERALLSHAYYLNRFFPALTQDRVTLEALQSSYLVIKEWAHDVETERKKFAGVNVAMETFQGIEAEKLAEAREMWSELITP